uniref:Uncharacterized protein n=1 Tax=Eutreptiella gymnastica TaxID=73025 RepID=A0A7S4G2W7_9EUGL
MVVLEPSGSSDEFGAYVLSILHRANCVPRGHTLILILELDAHCGPTNTSTSPHVEQQQLLLLLQTSKRARINNAATASTDISIPHGFRTGALSAPGIDGGMAIDLCHMQLSKSKDNPPPNLVHIYPCHGSVCDMPG